MPPSSASLSSTATTGHARHVTGLALLRGIAALSVCLYHFTGETLPKLHVNQLHSLFAQGNMGVIIFFVISGFIIPYSLLGKDYTVRKFWPYISKRIVRINPPAYVAMLLLIGQWYAIDYLLTHQIKYTRDITGGQVIHNMLFTVPFSEYRWFIGIFWTLAIEFQFYIFVGLFFKLVYENKRFAWFAGLFLLANLVHYLPWQSQFSFFRFSSLFALGAVMLFKQQGRLQSWVYWLALAATVALVHYEVGRLEAFVGLGTALAIEYVSIENGFTRFLGNISYSLYLVHSVVGTSCEFMLVKLIPAPSDAAKVLMQLICLMVAIAVAYVFYLVVEKPFILLANKIKLR